jgi:hypothetical protein
MARRYLVAIAGLALVLHGLGLSRSLIPAQDGLKFIRVAREFHRSPWDEVVRGSDQHPLYSALVALAEPPVALFVGESPTAWRVAAQLVSVLAALATLIPLFGLARALFGERAALLATLVYVLLPIPGAIGRDTLSDSLALLLFTTSLRLGEVALRTGRQSAWIATGLAGGVGYLARPEVLIVPLAVGIVGLLPLLCRWPFRARNRSSASDLGSVDPGTPRPVRLSRIGGLGVAALAIVGSYAIVKGELSEKLAIQMGMNVRSSSPAIRSVRPPMPPGLDDPRWNFDPKEESGEIHLKGSIARTSIRLAQQWAEGFGWIVLPFFVWGVVQASKIEGSKVGRTMIGVYLILFSAVVIRHATVMGYLSGRHALTLVVATVPWVGGGIWSWARSMPERRRLSRGASRRLAVVGLATLIALGVTVQVKAMHPSRWGHWAAGQWLIANARPEDAVLDTRGWARFVRGEPGYDYWHVRQALTDEKLAFVVVGTDELRSKSKRAATLRAMLSYAGELVAEFPDREGEQGVGVRIYRFKRPASWLEIRP